MVVRNKLNRFLNSPRGQRGCYNWIFSVREGSFYETCSALNNRNVEIARWAYKPSKETSEASITFDTKLVTSPELPLGYSTRESRRRHSHR